MELATHVCLVMSACRVPFHRIFEICKTRFYLMRCLRKRDNHTAFSHYSQYVRQRLYIQRDIQHKSRYTHAIYVDRSILQS